MGNVFDPRLNNSVSGLNTINRVSNQFNPVMAPKNDISGMNYNLAVNYGNQFNFENGHSFGYLGSLSYRREQTVYENSQDNIFNFSPDRSELNFEENRLQYGTIGGENIILSGLLEQPIKQIIRSSDLMRFIFKTEKVPLVVFAS